MVFSLLWLAVLGMNLACLGGGVVTNSSTSRLYAALLGGGRITFNTASDLTFNFAAPAEIAHDTIIDASTTARAVTLSGSNLVRIFTIRSNASLTLINLRLASGLSTNGGAIYNDHGTLRATNCLFRANTANGPDGTDGADGQDDFSIGGWAGNGGDGMPANGGAIYNLGRCELVLCQFEDNRANGGDGGDGGTGGDGGFQGGRGGDGGTAGTGEGGAIYNAGSLLGTECTFDANHATGGDAGAPGEGGDGGGINIITLAGFARAGAGANGGAVLNLGTATFLSCTFVTNVVAGGDATDAFTDATGWGRFGHQGGTVKGGAIANGGTLAATNCTFAFNAGIGGNGSNGGEGTEFRAGRGGDGGSALGGALWNGNDTTLVNVTLVGGRVQGGTGGVAGKDSWERDPFDPRDGVVGIAGGGNLSRTDGRLSLQNCIVSGSIAGGNGHGRLHDAGNNLSSDGTCAFTATGSRNNTDPRLGPFGSYGSSTDVFPPLLNSPAINTGATIPGLDLDQRGVARPQGAEFDIGAVERPFAGLSGTVTYTDGTPYPGVVLTLLSATAPAVTTTSDPSGHYEFTPVPGVDLGVYRIQAPEGGPGFDPPYWNVELTSGTEHITNLNFTGGDPRLIGPGFDSEGRFGFRLWGQPERTYVVHATAVLPSWQRVGEVTTDASGSGEFLDPSPISTDARFYRVTLP